MCILHLQEYLCGDKTPYKITWCREWMVHQQTCLHGPNVGCTNPHAPTDKHIGEHCASCIRDGRTTRKPDADTRLFRSDGELEEADEDNAIHESTVLLSFPLQGHELNDGNLVGAADPFESARSLVYRFHYCQNHDDWIFNRYESYAAENEGMRIPRIQLVTEFHEKFPGPNLDYMLKSVDNRISYIPRLFKKKSQYPRSARPESPDSETEL